ncbi:MAG: phosphatase PAP2 family protein [Parafilimonas sp.]
MQDKHKKLLQWFSLNFIISAVLLIVSVLIFTLIANEAVLEHEKIVDDKVFSFFDSIVTPGIINIMQVFTFFGSAQFLLPAYIVLAGYFFLRKKYINGFEIIIVGIASQALLYGLKQLFHRQRPNLSLIKNITTYSFPSGHTFSSLVFYSIIIYIIGRGKWKPVYKWITSIFLLLFALTIGLSRIILKVHYPTDVFASLCLAVAWVISCNWILKRINKKSANILLGRDEGANIKTKDSTHN